MKCNPRFIVTVFLRLCLHNAYERALYMKNPMFFSFVVFRGCPEVTPPRVARTCSCKIRSGDEIAILATHQAINLQGFCFFFVTFFFQKEKSERISAFQRKSEKTRNGEALASPFRLFHSNISTCCHDLNERFPHLIRDVFFGIIGGNKVHVAA